MTIPAGRALDYLVAEQVMDKHPVVGDWMGLATYRLTKEGKPLPYYSETWEGMRLVVERMRELGWFCEMADHGNSWTVKAVKDGRDLVVFEAAELPHAVCLAALAAVAQ